MKKLIVGIALLSSLSSYAYVSGSGANQLRGTNSKTPLGLKCKMRVKQIVQDDEKLVELDMKIKESFYKIFYKTHVNFSIQKYLYDKALAEAIDYYNELQNDKRCLPHNRYFQPDCTFIRLEFRTAENIEYTMQLEPKSLSLKMMSIDITPDSPSNPRHNGFAYCRNYDK